MKASRIGGTEALTNGGTMNAVLKFLNFVAGIYNNLPDEHKVLKNGKMSNFSKPQIDRTVPGTSKRKGAIHTDETTYNHPRR